MARQSIPGTEILVVDDNPANILAIRATLEPLGHVLIEAHSGREALRLLLERDFSLILLDVQMPGLDGFETAKLVRSRPRTAATPIIFVTAHGPVEGDVLRGYELGAVDFLFKPIVPEVLRAKASVFVELQRRTAEAQAQAAVIRKLERAAAQRRLAAERQSWEAERLRADNQRKDEFLAMLAHELRNPLAPLSSGLKVLAANKGSTEAEVVVPAMERQVEHLVRLVDDLLDVARVSRGKIQLSRLPLDVADVVRVAVETQHDAYVAKKHEVDVRCEGSLWVSGDSVRLTQVVQNLVSNAVRYTPEGGHIQVRAHRCDDQVVVEVSDDGRGIADDLLQRVFDLFVQERGDGEGLGLGLNLVQRLVSLHGGTVEAHSEGVGKGARFVVRLPAIAEPTDAGVPPTDERAESERSLKVLVVDDNEDILTTTGFVLKTLGHQPTTVQQGEVALQRAEVEAFDVALVDITMPDMDGYTVARRMRQLERCPRLVAVTGHADEASQRRIREAGFDAHLTKPADLSTLEDLLRSTPHVHT